MNTAQAKEVKGVVVEFFKQRGITQSDIGDRLALGRQTVSNILSNRDVYFNEKHAVLFSLGYGFNKRYLMFGEGVPMKSSSIDDARKAVNEILTVFSSILWVSTEEQKLLERTNPDSEMVKISRDLHSLYHVVLSMLELPSSNGESNYFDLTFATSFANISKPMINELGALIQKKLKEVE